MLTRRCASRLTFRWARLKAAQSRAASADVDVENAPRPRTHPARTRKLEPPPVHRGGAVVTSDAGARAPSARPTRPPTSCRLRTRRGAERSARRSSRRRTVFPHVTKRVSFAGKAPDDAHRRNRRCRSRRCRTCSASSRRRACISSAIMRAFPTSIPHQHRLMVHGLVRAAAALHDGRHRPLSVGVAHPLHRMRREHRHGVGQRRGARPSSTRTACSAAANGPACRSSTLLDEAAFDREARTLRAGRRRRRCVAHAHDPARHGASTTCSSCTARTARCCVRSKAIRCACSFRACRACRASSGCGGSKSATRRGTRARKRCTTST